MEEKAEAKTQQRCETYTIVNKAYNSRSEYNDLEILDFNQSKTKYHSGAH